MMLSRLCSEFDGNVKQNIILTAQVEIDKFLNEIEEC